MDLPGYIEKAIFGMTSLAIATKEELATGALPSRITQHEYTIKQRNFGAITRGVSQKIGACELTYRSREDVNFEKSLHSARALL